MSDDTVVIVDPVNHPRHYGKGRFSCECIAISRYMTFSAGNAFKYIWRYQEKGGLEDLRKSLVYLNWAIEDRIFAILPGYEDVVSDRLVSHVLPLVQPDSAYVALGLVADSRFDLAEAWIMNWLDVNP